MAESRKSGLNELQLCPGKHLLSARRCVAFLSFPFLVFSGLLLSGSTQRPSLGNTHWTDLVNHPSSIQKLGSTRKLVVSTDSFAANEVCVSNRDSSRWIRNVVGRRTSSRSPAGPLRFRPAMRHAPTICPMSAMPGQIRRYKLLNAHIFLLRLPQVVFLATLLGKPSAY